MQDKPIFTTAKIQKKSLLLILIQFNIHILTFRSSQYKENTYMIKGADT